MSEQSKLAWHFVGDTLRDGQPIPPDGKWLEYKGKCEMCVSGFHASYRIIDGVQYAPGPNICRVRVADIADSHDDKIVCARRKIIWRIDGTKILREFARKQALGVAHLWDMPQVVRRYLETGDEDIGVAAGTAARDAADAWVAAGAAARAAAWAAAWAAADAGDAAEDAADAAAEAAAWAADGAAARDAARDAANTQLTRMVMEARR